MVILLIFTLNVQMLNRKLIFFLSLSFLEGACVMAAELIGAKLLAPFFGSSLYVWSSVMAVTLIGLALGYFIGGLQSAKEGTEKRLYVILVAGSAIIALMPFTAQFCFALFSKMNLLPSVILSSMLLLVPPVFFMGMVSPFIIALIDKFIGNPGKSSGIVYAVSTVGGILATFLVGFYIIPYYGLTIPCIVSAILLGIVPAVLLLMRKNFTALFLILAVFFTLKASGVQKINSRIKVIAIKEGILGQLLVIDYPNDYYYNDPKKKGKFSRWLFVNRISQTMDDQWADISKGEERYFTYIYKIDSVLQAQPVKGKKILLLGLGGGSIASYFSAKGYSVEACELDQRIYHVAREYFSLPANVKVHIDDARHFINTCEKKYDVIIFDTFKGEETPSHVLTVESLKKVRGLLNKNGMLVINSFGYWKGKRGIGMRSIYKTLTYEKFNTFIVPTHASESQRNLVFFGSPYYQPEISIKTLPVTKTDLKNAQVLIDSRPIFEKLNAMAAISWRKDAIQTFLYDSLQRQLPFFN